MDILQSGRESLREILRHSTRSLHDRIDDTVGQFDLRKAPAYMRFLRFQLAAREPVESWMSENCPEGLFPPPQAPLLREDLKSLGVVAAPSTDLFDPGDDAEPLAVAWVIAGSHLGNRAMLASIDSSAATAELPRRFIADEGMTIFWRSLLPKLEEAYDPEFVARAVATAMATFNHFELHAAMLEEKVAA